MPYISTGEVSTQAYVNSAFGNRATAGQQVRCLDIRVPTGAGIFREGSNPQENAKLARDLKAFAKQCHGTAGRAFLDRLINDREAAKTTISELRKAFVEHPSLRALLASGPDGQVLRVLDQISILYATGCLASQFAVLPFSETQVLNAALLLLELWIKDRGGVTAQEDREAIETIRGFIQVNQFRFTRRIGDTQWSTPPKPVGYYLEEDDIFAIFPLVWKQEACSHLDERLVAEKLVAEGYLRAEMSRGRISKIAKKITIDNKRDRYVCLSAKLLGHDVTETTGDGTLRSMIA